MTSLRRCWAWFVRTYRELAAERAACAHDGTEPMCGDCARWSVGG